MVKKVLFCGPELVEDVYKLGGIPINASSNGSPYDVLSPFYVWEKNSIPVPGNEDYKSRSVEAIWQGLKIIDGKTNLKLFDASKVKKRRAPTYGQELFLYEGNTIPQAEAREKIFAPSYRWMFNNLVPKQLKEAFYTLAEKDFSLYFYDVDSNADIGNTTESYSHSSLLVDIINEELERRFPSLTSQSR